MSTEVATDRTGLVAILSRLVDPMNPNFTPEVARAILALNFSEKDQARAHDLAVRNGQGALTPAEHAELMDYVSADNLVALMWAKARKFLKDRGER